VKIVGAYCIRPYKISSITLDFRCWAYAIRPYGVFLSFPRRKETCVDTYAKEES